MVPSFASKKSFESLMRFRRNKIAGVEEGTNRGSQTKVNAGSEGNITYEDLRKKLLGLD